MSSRSQPSQEPPRPALTLPDKPSIAVLPFTELRFIREQEYFADGSCRGHHHGAVPLRKALFAHRPQFELYLQGARR